MTVSKAQARRAERMLAALAAAAMVAVAAAVPASLHLLGSSCPDRAAARLIDIGAGATFEALAASTRL